MTGSRPAPRQRNPPDPSRSRHLRRATPVPCAADNYAWILQWDGLRAVVDPTEAGAVRRAIDALGVRPNLILLTHHHADHVAGVPGLLEALGPLPVWCSAQDRHRIAFATADAGDGGWQVVAGVRIRGIPCPGHTSGAVTWEIENGPVFTGDTLFAAGCGRLFEGTAEQLDASLQRIVEGLPDDREICCGHEYTVANLLFAHEVLPTDPALSRALSWARSRRAAGEATVPTTAGWERRHNLYLRCDEDVVRHAVGFDTSTPRALVLARLRSRKDQWRAP